MSTKNNGKNEYVTKGYLEACLEKKNYVTKDYLDQKFEDFAKNMAEKFDLFAHKYIMPLWTDMQTVKGDINVIKADVMVIKSDIVDMKIDISDLKKDMKDVKKTVHKHDVQITALRDWTRVNQ